MPPGINELEDRLRKRSTEDESSLLERIKKAEKELSYAGKFDLTIVNDDLDAAVKEAVNTVDEFLNT